MKFSDGYWHLRDGVDASMALQVRDVEDTANGLTVIAVTKKVRHRGDTLNAPLVTIELSTPMADVVSVKAVHFEGRQPRHPQFALRSDATATYSVDRSDTAVTFTAGRLAARVDLGEDYRIDFVGDGRTLTSSGGKSLAFLETDGRHYIREQLVLGVGEHVYGLGERFGPLVKNGQSVDIWNADGGTSSEQAYKNIPFHFSDKGYGVFVNSPGLVSYEVASEAVSRVQFSVESHSLEYLVIYGPTPKEILSKYTALTGRPALPPAWSFGLWLTTSFTTSYDEATVTEFVDGMAERSLPLSVFHFDCFWMREFHWCDFTWDVDAFPDPAGMLERLKAKGLRICVWINPYIAQRSGLFREGAEQGYLVKTANGDVWQWDKWQAGMGLVDFTNPAACEWFASKLEALLDIGVDCFKSDFGERIPTDVVWQDGSDPERMHNYYAHLYNETVFELLRAHRGEGEAVLFARSATAGGQQFPVHWGGDCAATFPSMAESLRGGLSLTSSGFAFWSHDIGGFEGTPDAAVFKRWIPFGLLSSHSRLHGNESYRVPWLYDEESVDVLRDFTQLKMRLMPYVFAAAVSAHRDGVPVMRSMAVEFPDDPACSHLERQYMLGDSLLVAPVFSADGDVDYYVPEGTWTNLLSGQVVHGPGWVHEVHDFRSLPVLVRGGTVLPWGRRTDRPDYDYAEEVTLRVFSPHDAMSVRTAIPALDGSSAAEFVVSVDDGVLTVDRVLGDQPWSVELAGDVVHASGSSLVLPV
jgi:alpha-D-xyloside xylohydrolase